MKKSKKKVKQKNQKKGKKDLATKVIYANRSG